MILLALALLPQPEWRLIREGRSPDTIPFTLIRDVTTDRRGERAYVLDSRLHQVRIIGMSGRQLGSFGGGGEGPGELPRAVRLGWVGDTLWVADAPNRLHFFSSEGRFLRTRTGSVMPIAATATGGILSGVRTSPSAAPAQPANHIVTVPFVISHQSASGTRRVAVVESVLPLQVSTTVDGQRGTGFQEQPFRDDPLYLADREGRHLYLVNRRASSPPPHSFQVVKLTLSGDTVFARRFPYKPVPIDQRVIDARLQAQRDLISSQMPGRRITVDATELLKVLYRPAHLAPVEQAVIGRDGTIWLKRATDGTGATSELLMLSEAGELIGRARLPAREKLVAADRRRVWAIAADEDDVPFLVWYRIVP